MTDPQWRLGNSWWESAINQSINAGKWLGKEWVFSRWRNVDKDSADVTSAPRTFQISGQTIEKTRLSTVGSLAGSTTRRSAEWSHRQPGRSATRVLNGSRYCDADARRLRTPKRRSDDLPLDSLCPAQPVETGLRICDQQVAISTPGRTLPAAGLVLRWVTVCGRVNHLDMLPRSTQPGHPSMGRYND